LIALEAEASIKSTRGHPAWNATAGSLMTTTWWWTVSATGSQITRLSSRIQDLRGREVGIEEKGEPGTERRRLEEEEEQYYGEGYCVSDNCSVPFSG
jgi:hypothetical protein